MALAALAGASPAQVAVTELQAPGGAEQDSFGLSIALSGPYALVGAPYKSPKSRGRAYIFDAIRGELRATLAPSDWQPKDNFGRAVAVHGGFGAVSCSSDDLGINAGSVYVYDLQSAQLLYELHASDGQPGDLFGSALAMGSGRLVVAARNADAGSQDCGALYVFDVATGAQVFKLVADDAVDGMRLGNRLAVSGQHILAGAACDQPFAGMGAVYVFDLLTGQQRHKLKASNGDIGDYFGTALAAKGDLGLIGAPYSNLGPLDDLGRVYLFDLVSGQELHVIPSPVISGGARFGYAVAMADGLLLASAPGYHEQEPNAGTLFVFDEGSWVLRDQFCAPDAAEGDGFGNGIAATGFRALIGAPFEDDQGHNSGSAHLYCLLRPVGEAYCSPGNLNSTGLPAMLSAFGAADVGCDLFTLSAAPLPVKCPCLVIAGQTQGFVPFVGGGHGNLCLAGVIGRFRSLLDLSGLDGAFSVDVSLSDFPAPLSPAVVSGQTWQFQIWFRDAVPEPTSNLTDGLSVTFH